MKPHKNFYARYVLLKITMIQFRCVYLCRWCCYSVFSKILMIILSRLPLLGILQSYTCSIFTLRYNFCGYSLLKGVATVIFLKFLKLLYLAFCWMKLYKNLCAKIHIIRNNNDTLTCMHPNRGIFHFFKNFCDTCISTLIA